jgi:hypothetical protein
MKGYTLVDSSEGNIVSFEEFKDKKDQQEEMYIARSFVFALTLIDPDIASFSVRSSDFISFANEFKKLKRVSAYGLTEYTGYNPEEIDDWINGETPSKQYRTQILIAMDLFIKEKYDITA